MTLNIFTAGTDAEAEKVNENFQHVIDIQLRYIGSDLTAETSLSASETKIGEVLIPANTVNTELIISATVTHDANTSSTCSTSFKCKAGTSTTITSNTQFGETFTLTTNGSSDSRIGSGVFYRVTGLDWSVDNYVQIGGIVSTVNVAFAGCSMIMILGR